MDTSPDGSPLLRRTSDHPTDPSALTTQQLTRAIAGLREILEARMDGTDKLIVLLQLAADQRKEAITAEVDHLRLLHNEKFSSIQTQFSERDTRTEQAAGAVKIAVDAALQAQKEAVGEQNKSSALAIAKSENSTTKQIDQIGLTIQATTSNLNDKIDDVKARLLTIDGQVKGGKEIKDDGRATIAIVVSVLMAALAIGSLIYKGSKQEIVYVPAPVAVPATATK